MKELITDFVLGIFRKRDWSMLVSIPGGWFNSVFGWNEIQKYFIVKIPYRFRLCDCRIPLFLAVMYAAFGMRETSALGRTINYQVFEQTKAIRLVLQKTADIERKARLFVLLSDPALRQPYEQQSYENTRASFKQALGELLKLHVDNKIALLVNELSRKRKI